MDIQTIQNQKTELEKESSKLHSRITSELHIPTKNTLIAKESSILTEIQRLQVSLDQLNEPEYAKKTLEIILKNRNLISLKTNQQRIPIDKDGNVTVTFQSCKHKQTLPISQFLNFAIKKRNNPPVNRITFERWRQFLKPNATTKTVFTGSLTCSECLKKRKKKFDTTRRYTNTPIPSLSYELYYLS